MPERHPGFLVVEPEPLTVADKLAAKYGFEDVDVMLDLLAEWHRAGIGYRTVTNLDFADQIEAAVEWRSKLAGEC